jgi:hypothetical protein
MSTTNGTATTWGQTFTLADLQRLERELAAMPKPPWTLIGPDGRAWQDTDPQKLLRVLAAACFPPLSAHGVAPTVPADRPATLEEAQHAAEIGACLPNGLLFDAFGRQRVRYVRVIHDGTTCVVPPGDVAAMVDSERPDDYRTEDVYLSKEEFDALPEFDGF